MQKANVRLKVTVNNGKLLKNEINNSATNYLLPHVRLCDNVY
jgi:hypothetical protein